MRALLSVANRDGIVALARDLLDLDVEVFATDGTREFLAAEGVAVTSVSELTQGEPDVGGQVKTFHHAVYAGILARRDVPAQLEELRAQGIGLIDLVVVNVKPFAPAIGVKLVGLDEAIEMIDVGGAALLGAAARNAAGVASVADPAHYPIVTRELRELGTVSPETRAQAGGRGVQHGRRLPRRDRRLPQPDLRQHLPAPPGDRPREGRRPALRREPAPAGRVLPRDDPSQRHARRRRPAAGRACRRSTTCSTSTPRTGSPATTRRPTVAIVKHTDPVGLASHDELVEAYRHALETDPVAAFGGIVGGQPRARRGDRARDRGQLVRGGRRARASASRAIGILRGKPGLELLAIPPDPTEGMRDYGIASLDFKRVAGGLLVESLDELGLDRGRLQVVTKRRPTLEELTDLLFAWRAVRHVRSNAVVLARNGATVGIGAGQASRQVSVEIAVRRAGDRAKLAVLASDAYFPFPDGIQAAAGAGVTAIIQPGGSIRDEMAIEVADRHHMAMVFTGRRHFRH